MATVEGYAADAGEPCSGVTKARKPCRNLTLLVVVVAGREARSCDLHSGQVRRRLAQGE